MHLEQNRKTTAMTSRFFFATNHEARFVHLDENKKIEGPFQFGLPATADFLWAA
jgi:hypothetical protein